MNRQNIALWATLTAALHGCGDDTQLTAADAPMVDAQIVDAPAADGPPADAPATDAAIDADPCAVCLALAACDLSSNAVSCVCPQGFTGDGTVAGTGCTDIDECALGTNDCGPDTCVNTQGSYDCRALIGTDFHGYEVFHINSSTYAVVSAADSTMPAGTPQSVQGMAAHPATGALYGIIRLSDVTSGQRMRAFATLDIPSYTWTQVGLLNDAFTSLAFDNLGTLYTTTGRGGFVPGCQPGFECGTGVLYSLDATSATPTQLTALNNGGQGEVLAFNPDDGFLYLWSGKINTQLHMSKIDLATNPPSVTSIPLTGADHWEIYGAVWSPFLQKFIATEIYQHVYTIDTNGLVTYVGMTTMVGQAYPIRGLTWTTLAPRHKILPNSGPAAGGGTVTITGLGVGDIPGATVSFGAVSAGAATRIDHHTLTTTVPAGASGAVEVQVIDNRTYPIAVYSYTYQ